MADADWILDQLEDLGPVTARRMFGGVGFFAGGVMFALLHRDVLHFRAGDAARPHYEAAGSTPFSPRPGTLSRTWLSVPDAVLDDADELVAWARDALRDARDAAAARGRRS